MRREGEGKERGKKCLLNVFRTFLQPAELGLFIRR